MIQHLAAQMDGNRRWALSNKLAAMQGHRKGIDTVERIATFCLEKKIPYLSLYTFSLENFNRSDQEKNYLFDLMIEGAERVLKTAIEKEVRIRFLGERSLFPDHVRPVCEKLENVTAAFKNLNLNFLFFYGAQQEIVAGIKHILAQIKNGILKEEDLNSKMFANYLWTAGMPDPELIIRPGGVVRLSNFMLYQAAYSEWYFTNKLWPDMDTLDFEDALTYYTSVRRNFGK